MAGGRRLPGHASTRTSRTWCNGAGESYWLFKNAFDRDSYDGDGATMKHGQQRPDHRLPQRQLERRHHQLLRRRHVRRHRLARVGPRLHRVHLRPDLPVAVGRAERGLLRRLGRDRRHDQHARQRGARPTPRTDGRRARPSPRPSTWTINAPPSVAGPCDAAAASFGAGVHDDVTAQVVAATDAAAASRPTAARRSPTPPHVTGKFVYVDRGTCTFDVKVDNAEAAGATGIVIGNNDGRPAGRDAGSTPTIPGVDGHPGRRRRDQGRSTGTST